MEPSAWVNRLKRRMGHPVVSISTPDETVREFIQEALERIQPYQRETEFISGRGPVIDVSEHKVLSVVRVLPSKTLTPAIQMSDFDVFTAVNVAPMITTGGSLVSVLARNLYRTELDAAIPKDWELREGKVYISGYSGTVTLEVFTESCMKELPEVYKQWCFDYSLALLKITEGEIRSKTKVRNAPMELNGEALKQEGTEEKIKLEERLGTELASFFAIR